MSKAGEALADVRGWLCDNLSDGDAGKVCGMLSVVSRHIFELEEENAKLRMAMDFQAIELGCMTDNRDYLYLESAKLRELACEMYEDQCDDGDRWKYRDRMRKLGIEVDG